MSFASFRRFWAVAANRNSSLAPFGPHAAVPSLRKPQQRGTEKRRRIYSGIRLKPLGSEDSAKTDPDYMAPEP
jgi:hypothetical protein